MYAAGPLLVHCVTKDLYLHVGSNNSVDAKSEASEFYLKRSMNSKYPDEFYICVKRSKPQHASGEMGCQPQHAGDESENTRQLLQYLQTPLNVWGNNSGSLQVGYEARNREIRLVLRGSIRRRRQRPVSMSAWMSGSEVCFIQCARRKPKNGYIAVKQDGSVCCVRSKLDSSIGTLFQIVWVGMKENKNMPPSPRSQHAPQTGLLWNTIDLHTGRAGSGFLPELECEDGTSSPESVAYVDANRELRPDPTDLCSPTVLDGPTVGPVAKLPGRAELPLAKRPLRAWPEKKSGDEKRCSSYSPIVLFLSVLSLCIIFGLAFVEVKVVVTLSTIYGCILFFLYLSMAATA